MALHETLARRRARQRRLSAASAAAAAGALVGALLGLDLWARLALVVAPSTAALFLPDPSARRWALAWIGERAGLAYETALVEQGEDDPYGMRRELRTRAARAAASVESPTWPAWWLPLAIVALGILLLPELPGFGLGLPSPGTGGSLAGDPSGEVLGEQALPNESEEAVEPVGFDPSEPARAERDRDDAPAGGESAEGSGTGADTVGEQEALERFVGNLRERPQEEPPGDETQPERAGDGGDGRRRDGSGEATERRPGEGRPGGERSEAGNEEGSSSDQAAGEGQGGDQEEPQGGAEADGGETAAEDETSPGGEAGGTDPEGAEANEGGQGEGAGDPGLDEGGEEQPGVGEGAGALPSVERQSGDPLGEAGSEPEVLEGQLLPGRVNPGGIITLPGYGEGDLPAGRSPEAYRRAVERAVSEGSFPVEYQEIIRNYFR